MSLATLMTGQQPVLASVGQMTTNFPSAVQLWSTVSFKKRPSKATKMVQRMQTHRIFVCFLDKVQIHIKAGRLWQCNNRLDHGGVRHYSVMKELSASPFGLQKCFPVENVLFLLYIPTTYGINISYCTCLKWLVHYCFHLPSLNSPCLCLINAY